MEITLERIEISADLAQRLLRYLETQPLGVVRQMYGDLYTAVQAAAQQVALQSQADAAREAETALRIADDNRNALPRR